MSVPTSGEMGEALVRTGKALLTNGLIQSDHVFQNISQKLNENSIKNNKNWEYEIPEANPIQFVAIKNSQIDSDIRPRVYASIGVQHGAAGGVCFKKLDLALEVSDDEGKILIKHHIDLANPQNGRFQQGPLFHLQFGGHTPKSSRTFEVPLKEPRWLHTPLDVILLCEVVVANFYPDYWIKIKQSNGWLDPIILSQKLCIAPFVSELNKKINASSKSLLEHLWAIETGPDYVENGYQP